jgi:predicted small lipoprotein YifL
MHVRTASAPSLPSLRPRFGAVSRASLACAALLALAGCGSKEEPAAAPPQDIVGLLELPVAHRGSPSAPTDAARVDIGTSELRLDGRAVTTLTNGALAQADVNAGAIPKLRSAIAGSRATALLNVHAATPWATTVAVLETLRAGGVRNAVFAVRRVPPPPTKGAPPPSPSMTASYFELRDFQVVAEAEGEVSFANVTPVPWGEIGARWDAVKDACAQAPNADCMWKPETIAEGGNAQITLRSRGDGLKVEFAQVGAPAAPAAPAMIEGVPPPPPAAGAEAPPPPATEASFTLRSGTTTEPASPVSAMMANVCGSRACGVVVISDPEQMSMRVLSLVAAAFPEGSAPPAVAFRRPR